jgi:PAS domain S-box-containing protein
MGWQISPPYQLSNNGEPTGLAVELVRKAAQRRGIDLHWVLWPNSSEFALRDHQVDLWPLITITPERLKSLHITEPYVEVEHTFLVRAGSTFQNPQDLATATVSVANFALQRGLLLGRLPNARAVSQPTARKAIEDVCQQRADAAYMDVYTAIAALSAERDCPGQPLRWIPTPDVQTRLGVGSTFEARAAADAIREEIGSMAREGTLAPIIGKWGFTPAQNLISMEALVDARRRDARLGVATALFALLTILACWQTVRVTRERSRTRRTEKALHEADQKLRLMANNLREMVVAFGMDRKLIYANSAMEALTGYSRTEYMERGFIDWIHPDDRSRMLGRWEELFRGGSYRDEEYHLVTKGGGVKWVSASWGPILDEAGRQVGVQGTERDITDRKRAEEALRESQARYIQAQKLESIGRLAGGVAHDFNNLLTVINGYSDIIYKGLAPQDPLRARVEQIRRAGARASDLTKQLLAFSRKQVIQPQPVNFNSIVAGSEPMFQRLLGEEIQLIVKLQPDLGPVLADSGQMHQVLMNLLVNARDAMPDGGKVFIETADAEITEAYVAEHPEAVAGPAVLLEVTDSGVGMDEETQKNIFEPFFTTKDPSAGTGLGLATVYGIVKQSSGWILLYSEPGKGSSFKIYLPRIANGVLEQSNGEGDGRQVGGSETVLVVEDQEEVRSYAVHVLKAYGYQVLAAHDGPSALTAAETHPGPIHVLLTDVVLPGMNGKQLADRLTGLRPELKVLYTSGYTRDVIAHRGVLDADVAYLAKPYSPEALAAKMREVI